MPRVLVTPPQFQNPERPYYQNLVRAGFEVVFARELLTAVSRPELIAALQGIDAVLTSTEGYTREVLAATRMRVVARAGVGFDSVDIAAATELGIVVTITPGAVERSVAEQTLASILAIYRDVIGRDREVREGKWLRTSRPRLAGKTLGLVGLGRIGRTLAPLARAVGLNVIAFDPCADAAFAAENSIGLVGLEQLFRTADIVSLHCPATAETTNLINAERLGWMKPDAVLINLGRGPLVDEDALVAAMKRGHLLGAALDVFKQEPLPANSPLLTVPNLIVSPHTGGLDYQSEEDMSSFAAQNIIDLYQGRWPERSIITSGLKGKWKW